MTHKLTYLSMLFYFVFVTLPIHLLLFSLDHTITDNVSSTICKLCALQTVLALSTPTVHELQHTPVVQGYYSKGCSLPSELTMILTQENCLYLH